MIRVLVAEDSKVVRTLLIEILESDPEIRVVGQAETGLEAVALAARLRPDLVTMDVHMPAQDGLDATREIMIRAPVPIIIVSSSASSQEMELSFKALQAGALMVLQKPDNPASARFNGRSRELVAMVKAMAQVKVVRRWGPSGTPVLARRPQPAGRTIRAVAIVASTGGPAALQRLLGDLPADCAAPILVVQHMASGFVAGLAQWLNEACALRVKIAEHGEPVRRQTVYLAPDDQHLGVEAGRVVVSDEPPINGFRPSGTFLFDSAGRTYGGALAGVILTGMGSDGVEGLRRVKAAGGLVLAQDEDTSIVYGMPREAVSAGIVDAVLPIHAIAAHLADRIAGGRE